MRGLTVKIGPKNLIQKERYRLHVLILPKLERIGALKTFADIYFRSVRGNELIKMRKEFNLFRWKVFKRNFMCECCEYQMSRNIHHIVMLKNGGSNKLTNLIALCVDCHSQIHDWLEHEKEIALEQTNLIRSQGIECLNKPQVVGDEAVEPG